MCEVFLWLLTLMDLVWVLRVLVLMVLGVCFVCFVSVSLLVSFGWCLVCLLLYFISLMNIGDC